MIRAEDGEVELKGNTETLYIELASIMLSLLITEDVDEQDLYEIVRRSVEIVDTGKYENALKKQEAVIVDIQEYLKQMQEAEEGEKNNDKN